MLFLKVFYFAEWQTFVERRPVIYESTQTEREKQKSNIIFEVKLSELFITFEVITFSVETAEPKM